jgi:hypothetical protein
MNLSQIEQDIYDFVIVPRTAIEIMEFIGHKTPPYGALRFLQRVDLVDKISPYQRAKAKFVQSGRPMKTDPVYVREVQTVMGVRI